MADGCLLLVDAVEGPMPQTRTVLAGRWSAGCARSSSSTRSTARHPASTRRWSACRTSSWSWPPTPISSSSRSSSPSPARGAPAPSPIRQARPDLRPLFETIVREVPPPDVDPEGPAQMLVASLDYDPHRGGSPSAACSRAPSAPATRWSSSARTARRRGSGSVHSPSSTG